MGKITLQKDIKIIPFIAGLVLWIGYLYFNHRVNTFSNSVVRKKNKNIPYCRNSPKIQQTNRRKRQN
jgi:hypothetical protein